MSAQGIRISVVIPHMNQPEFLVRSLAALAEQTFEMSGAEIIVVDNGSDTMPVATCAPYPNVRLAVEATPGPGPARNHGVALSHAPLLAFVDADCLADKNWLETIVSAFDAAPELQAIGGDVRIALEDPGRMTMLEAYESVFAYRQKDYIERQGFSGTGNLAMRRAAYERVGPFAGIGVAEDRDWGHRATRAGIAIRYVPDMIVYHPARKDLAELRVKWDRQMAHDYEEQVTGAIGSRMRWFVKAGALAVSPLLEIPRILTSNRLSLPSERFMALRVLARIRVYRAGLAFKFLFTGAGSTSGSWNRAS